MLSVAAMKWFVSFIITRGSLIAVIDSELKRLFKRVQH